MIVILALYILHLALQLFIFKPSHKYAQIIGMKISILDILSLLEVVKRRNFLLICSLLFMDRVWYAKNHYKNCMTAQDFEHFWSGPPSYALNPAQSSPAYYCCCTCTYLANIFITDVWPGRSRVMPLLCHTSVSLITFMTRINVRTLTIGRMWLASLVQIFTRWILIALLCCCPVELICLPVLSLSAVRKVCIKICHCDPIV